jgi:hypothetical protein
LPAAVSRPLRNIQNNETGNTENIDSDLTIVGFSQLGSEIDWRTAITKISIQNGSYKKEWIFVTFQMAGRVRKIR